MKKYIILFLLILSGSASKAKVQLSPLISDNMVLQRDANVNISGKTDAHKTVSITPSWSGVTYKVKADAKGEWSALVKTSGAGGPYSMTISDGEKLVLHNLLLGDVWICSGQSNMEMVLRGFTGQPVENSLNFILESNHYPNIRMFTVKRVPAISPQMEIGGKWEQSSMDCSPDFSAVAYFYAKTLNEVLGIPIGIVHTSWGGANIETWMSGNTLKKYSSFNEKSIKLDTPYPQQMPTLLFNGMIYPLKNMSVKGFVWYQGESNIGNYEQYTSLFADMVKEWRGLFPQAEQAPFYFAQIAPFQYDGWSKDNSAFLREAQAKCLSVVPHTGMAVTLDIGELTCIHPSKKEEVGQRLAYQALAKTYHKTAFPCDGPVLKTAVTQNGKMVLSFDNAEIGLYPMHTNLEGFELAAEDGVFVPAKAMVSNFGNTMEVWSDELSNPKYVRYGFRNYVKASLFNAYYLPAGSFRTDDFKVQK